jgi:hypothetical protein
MQMDKTGARGFPQKHWKQKKWESMGGKSCSRDTINIGIQDVETQE